MLFARLALVLVTIQTTSAEQTPLTSTIKPIITPEFTHFVETLQESESVPGIALGVVHEGRTVFNSWGIRSEDGTNVTSDTLFGIASCSKAFASAALGILIDDFANGKNVTALPAAVARFDWHTKLRDLLPEDWKLADHWADQGTHLRDVLSHVSGISSHDHSYLPEDSPTDVIRRMRSFRPTFELRQQWQYSNQFYMVAAQIISRYSGMGFDEYVQKRIFDPLGMSSSTYSASQAARSGRLSDSWNREARLMPYCFPDDRKELVAGPMGVISSVEDLIKWVKVWLNDGRHPLSGEVVIPLQTLEETTSPSAIMYDMPIDSGFSIAGYAMGWARWSYYGHEVIWHPGGVPGVTSLVAFLPKEKTGLVVLINASAKDKVTYPIVYRLLAELFNINTEEPVQGNFENFYQPAQEHTGYGKTDFIDTFDEDEGSNLYVGTYANGGYRNITLCTSTSTSGDCPDVLNAFERVDEISPYKSHLNLYASYPGIWASHLRLLRVSDGEHTFQAQFTYLFPYGHGKNTTGFEMWEPGLSEAIMKFVVEEQGEEKRVVGIGMYRMSGDVSERQRLGSTVQETADVWWVPA